MPRIEGDLAEALRLLRDYFERKEIPFALVGALVPALLLSSDVGARETRDADHVIKLASWTEWEAVIADLVKLGFKQDRGEHEHHLYYRNAEIDLIPFGVTNGPEEVLVWRKSGNKMNMAGLSDGFRHAKPIEVSQGLTIPVVPLWVFAVLKVIAYLDRKFSRDLYDLIYVLEHYETSGEESRRFEVAGGVDGVTYETSRAYLLGCDVGKNASEKALELVKGFVAPITDEHHKVINTILREENHLYSEDRRQFVYLLIKIFRKGLA